MKKEGTITTSELPDSFMSASARVIHGYSTGLIRIDPQPDGSEIPTFIGSGTFVTIGHHSGILTAHHVSNQLSISSQLGVILVEGLAHRNTIPRQLVDVISINESGSESDGPDISIILLPPAKAKEISNWKHFFDLSTLRSQILSSPHPLDWGVWFVCGIPDEDTLDEAPIAPFDRTSAFFGQCGLAGADRMYEVSGFDYIESDIHYSQRTSPPNSFGGFSGGGLWNVTIQHYEDGGIEPTDYRLTGVIFYQSPLVEGKHFLKSHGPKSIYDRLYSKVQECS